MDLVTRALQEPAAAAAIGRAVRGAIDDVLDTYRTGRFDIRGPDVSRQEKAFVGTRFEIRLIAELSLDRGQRMDCLVAGHEIDIKFTLGQNWMIPVEAVDQLCLLVKANDDTSEYSAYVARMGAGLLTAKGNRDRKKSLTAAGLKRVRVIVEGAPLESNVLLHMSEGDRAAIFRHKGQEDRFAEFFERRPGRIVTRQLLLAIGRHGDSMKRVRAIKGRLATRGLLLLCGTWRDDRLRAEELGGPVPAEDQWVCLRVTP